jgi:hypothetical protein
MAVVNVIDKGAEVAPEILVVPDVSIVVAEPDPKLVPFTTKVGAPAVVKT